MVWCELTVPFRVPKTSPRELPEMTGVHHNRRPRAHPTATHPSKRAVQSIAPKMHSNTHPCLSCGFLAHRFKHPHPWFRWQERWLLYPGLYHHMEACTTGEFSIRIRCRHVVVG
ncbi:hypothetical protein CDAR_474791 [Caerostris darwini]|uniref:Uncharacterized protein n=1 Tax=Caerostris darwini TaxID=1538125 RepID=A0AAV4MVA0_9ARAC|nr:hypothetical protein CDAR_474791 [Caerostris darwini]